MDIYVGNLPYDIEESFVRETFEGLGAVESVKIIMDHETGRSKGFAFVTMTNDEEARKAIEELNGADLDGRAVKVNEARPKSDNPRQGGGRGGFQRGGGNRGGGGGRDRRPNRY